MSWGAGCWVVALAACVSATACGGSGSQPAGYAGNSGGGAAADSGPDGAAGAGDGGVAGQGGSIAVDGGLDSGGGFAGTSDAGGQAGSGGSGCVDPGPEPNDSEPLASPACGTSTCNLTDCDSDGSTTFGGPLAPAQGVLSANDTDFFTFDGKDTFGCVVDPTATTQQSGFRLCVFAACRVSATTFKSCTHGTSATSPDGLPGCCTDAPGTVTADYSCTSSLTSDDSAKIYIRADRASACTPYVIDYHF